MTAKELKQKYLDFFVAHGHKILPNVSLIPENDPTALFTSAGMHPLVPYLLGELHPLGKRLVSVQRCLRTGDIDKVGNAVHHTFFEMLGNWSLGDYWKSEAIAWSYEFLTAKEWLGIDKERIAISVFAGDKDAPFDEESYQAWLKLGIPEKRIAKLSKEDNWWGPAGETGPCGPDTEMFVGEQRVEVWNDVFMEYEKKVKGREGEKAREEFEFIPLKQKNVDTGLGLERMLAVLNGLDDDYQTEVFLPIIQLIESAAGRPYQENKKEFRVIADHLRAATFLISDGVVPSNLSQGYVLRRLIRRAIRHGRLIHLNEPFVAQVAQAVMATMKDVYPDLEKNQKLIVETLTTEEEKFDKTLSRGLKEIEKYQTLDGKTAFYLYETYGFPVEMTEEIATEKGQKIDKKLFEEEFKKHQELSQTASAGMFKGGLADNSAMVTQYHTATHLLQATLRQVLGEHVQQKGSNLTAERLRFDFAHPQALTSEEIKKVEDLVNQKIKDNLPVKMEMMPYDEAKKRGALAFFSQKYGEQVKVYTINGFSVEICGGPHTDFTGKLGKFKIIKEQSASAGVRRIYATLEQSA